MVNKYYDLATSFYEYGWGESFHFAHRYKWETLRESIVRHEHLASKLDVGPGDKVLDVGCGVGGPLREIAAFTGASITGLNNNAFQIKRGEELNRATRQARQLRLRQGGFHEHPKPDNTYDAVYQIEVCHAPDAVEITTPDLPRAQARGAFSRRGGASPTRTTRRTRSTKIRQEILIGNGLPTARHTHEVLDALKKAGFEVVEEIDLVETADVPWCRPIDPYRVWVPWRDFWSFKTTLWGRHHPLPGLQALETVGIAPKGSMGVSRFLKKGADGLVAGGKAGIYTVMYYTKAVKPK